MAEGPLQSGGCCDGVGCSGRLATTCLLLSITFFLYAKLLLQDASMRDPLPDYFWGGNHLLGPFSLVMSPPKSDSERRPGELQGQGPNHTDPHAGEHQLEPKSGSEKGPNPSATGSDSKVHDDSSGSGSQGQNHTSGSDFHDRNDGSTGGDGQPNAAPPAKKFTVFIGVFMMPFEYGRREVIRAANAVQSAAHAEFTVRFVLGGYQLPDWLHDENATRGDLIVLPCKENLNSGKTFTYFATLPALLPHPFDYVMKTDDDSYVRFENLGKHLEALPRKDLYYGYTLPCGSPWAQTNFRVGAGYILSWDLVLWIGSSPIPRNQTVGTEDRLVGQWFEDGGVGRNRPVENGLFHDHPWQGGRCAQNLTSETILVHKLKTDDRWRDVVAFFNNTHH